MGIHAKVEPYDRARFLMKIASSLGGDAHAGATEGRRRSSHSQVHRTNIVKLPGVVGVGMVVGVCN